MAKRLKVSDLKKADEVLKGLLGDDEFRNEWNRTALARAVALRIVRYRAEYSMSQTELAKKLGMKQPAIARLEAGEKNPTWETLTRLSKALGIEFQVNITPNRRRHLISKELRKQADVVEASEDGTMLVALR